MKRILPLVLTVLFPAAAVAQEAPPDKPLDLGGITTLLANKVKEAKGATIFSAKSKPAAALYLPVWTFHDSQADLVEVGAGGKWVKSASPSVIAVAAANLPGLSARLWNFQWAKDHLKRSPFPPIFFGPTLTVPLEMVDLKAMRWDHYLDYLGLVVSVRLGGK